MSADDLTETLAACRCGRCGAYIYGEAVKFNGWWLHEECVPSTRKEPTDEC